jgi:hypothetical protein
VKLERGNRQGTLVSNRIASFSGICDCFACRPTCLIAKESSFVNLIQAPGQEIKITDHIKGTRIFQIVVF